MIERKEYLTLLKSWKDENIIKVISGIRRCGKSTMLLQFVDYLKSIGVSSEQIIFINFEDLQYEHLLDYRTLYAHLTSLLCEDRMTYVILDEVQKVDGFEKVVDSLHIKNNVDIYITGSNAYLLSGELATLLSGRYVEINMLPLSFAEYYEIKGATDKDGLFADYMTEGSFPYIAALEDSSEKAEMYLEGIYNTIIIKDIEERQKRKERDPNKRKVNDIILLKNISKFLAGSVGNPISIKSIADYVTSQGRKTSQNTVTDYIEALVEPYIFYPCERYDIYGKQLLKISQKYYIADPGIRRYLLARRNYDLGFTLENVIYLELRRRGYTVNVGKAGNLEVDFVARRKNKIEYYQVTASMLEESTFNREITPLRNINDNYAKTIITLDRFTLGDYDGINVVNAVDWLLER